MVKTAKHYAEKKKEFVQLAANLFIEKGYEETSVEDIFRASGVSKGGFYHYFKSKEEVLVEIANTLVDEILQELNPIVEDKSLGAFEKLKLLFEKQLALKLPQKVNAQSFVKAIRSDFTLYKFNLTLSQRFVEPLVKVIDQGNQEGVFHVAFPRETAEILIRLLATAPYSEIVDQIAHDETKLYQYFASLQALILRGLGIDYEEMRLWDEKTMGDISNLLKR